MLKLVNPSRQDLKHIAVQRDLFEEWHFRHGLRQIVELVVIEPELLKLATISNHWRQFKNQVVSNVHILEID